MDNLAGQMDRIQSNLLLFHTVYLSSKEPGSKTHSMTEKNNLTESTGPIRLNNWFTTAQLHQVVQVMVTAVSRQHMENMDCKVEGIFSYQSV